MRPVVFSYINGEPHKHCSQCKELKSVDKFLPRPNRPSGVSSACRACLSSNNVEYQRKNPEKAYLHTKAWREKNPDRVLENQRRHRATDKAKQTINAWIDKNRASINLRNRARNLMRRGMRKNVTKARILELLKLQKGRCAVCRNCCSDSYHVDHIVPVSKGGDSSPENLQILCPACNTSKGARDATDFMQSRGFLL